MNDFLVSSLTFPTLLFSIVLCVCVLYWVLAAFGLFDATDGWTEVDMDVGDFVDAADPQAGSHGLAGLLARFGLSGVPFMVMLTILAFTGWILSYYAQLLVLSHLGDTLRWALGAGIVVAALAGGVFLTALVLKPLKWAIRRLAPEPHAPVLGRAGVVISPVLDGQGGRVEIADGGAGLVFHAHTTNGASYPRGARVVLVARNDHRHEYEVISQSEFDNQ